MRGKTSARNPPEDGSSTPRSDAPHTSPPPSASGDPGAARLPAPVERGLEAPDALTRYLAELRNHPPISREEEHALAVRMIEEGDRDAARRLVTANLRLVVKIAMEYRRVWANVLDLIGEGNLGLLEAVSRFDPYRGVKLSTYAVYWIRAYILKYLLDNKSMVRLGTTRAQRKLWYRLNREKRELERQGLAVEPRLIAERLDVPEEEVVDMETRLAHGDLSLETPVSEERGGATFGDFLATGGESSESVVGDRELTDTIRSHLEEFAKTLDDRDVRILDERILAEDPKTLQALADDYGLTRERVRQLEVRIVSRLKEFLRGRMVDFEYYAPEGERARERGR